MTRPFLPSDMQPSDPLKDWKRYVTVRAVAGVTGNKLPHVATRLYGDKAEAVMKAAVVPASTTNWGSSLAGTKVGSFLRSLRPRSAAAQLLDRASRFDMSGVATISLPRLTADFPAPAWVNEAGAIPVYKGSFGTDMLGPPKKLAALAGLTTELGSLSAQDAEAIVTEVMEDAAAKQLDASLFSTTAASATRPAGLLAGVTPIAATTGGGQAALLADLKALGGAMSDAGFGADFMLFVNLRQAMSLGVLMTGPQPFEVVAHPSIPAGTVIAVHPAAFASGFGAEPKVEVADNAVIQYDDAPSDLIGTSGTPNVVSAPVFSAFQNATHVLRLILQATWIVRRPGAVQVINSASW